MPMPYSLDRGSATLACVRTPGASPGVLFLGGYRSDMTGQKATALEAHCAARGRAFVRFDYSGHGASGGRFADCVLGTWRDDALAVLDRLTEGPQVLAGSSMGVWIALLVARERPGRVAGIVGVAGAPDFTEDLVWGRLGAAERARVLAEGRWTAPSRYGDGDYHFTAALIAEARDHLVLRGPVAFDGPVRLLHGTADPDVPWETSKRLLDRLTTADASLTLVEDGDHRLSRPDDLALLCRAVDEVAARAPGGLRG
jgi:pimeloyl-ACP methyl ester carboxylesterase